MYMDASLGASQGQVRGRGLQPEREKYRVFKPDEYVAVTDEDASLYFKRVFEENLANHTASLNAIKKRSQQDRDSGSENGDDSGDDDFPDDLWDDSMFGSAEESQQAFTQSLNDLPMLG